MDREEIGACSSPVPCDEEGESLSNMEGFTSQAEDESLDIGMEEADHDQESGNEQPRRAEEEPQRVTVTADDILRMEFNDPDEAIRFYQQYSRGKGFAMRQGKKLKNKRGEVVRHTYLCNRQGFREKKWLEMQGRKREHKMLTRCGCPAEMRIKPIGESGKWYVSRFVDEHNHELLPAKYVDFLPPHKKMTKVDRAHMDGMRQVGISILKIYEHIAAQAGGFTNVTFGKRDMYNEVRRQKAEQDGDVNAALRVLENAARVDEKMFWRYEVGPGQHLCEIFWSDGRSQDDYGVFGDVLAFDATYGRNKYNLPVIVFSGVNHHNQTCVFAAAMVSCESEAAYVWVLRKFLECMGGKAPKAVITDGDRSMRLAIQEVFPHAHHRLCAWYLLRNATVHVCNPRFTQLFKQCMPSDVEAEEFETMWESMLEVCGVREVEWVKDLYAKKYSWATAYIRGSFFAGLRTTSRCESLHAKLGRFLERRYGILQFVTNFQRCVAFLRDNEEELDFKSCYRTPVLQTQFPELEKSGAKQFTQEIFARFRESLQQSVRVLVLECHEHEEGKLYVAEKYRRPGKKWSVLHVVGRNTFKCTCQRMESFGLPCVHILAVLVRIGLEEVPESLVLKRWSKSAKGDLFAKSDGVDNVDAAALYRSRLGAFLQHCKRLARAACLTDEDFRKYVTRVVHDTLELERKNSGDAAAEGIPAGGRRVKDPVTVRTKGTGRGNDPVGSRGVKRRKCSTCGEAGHRRTRCPNGSRSLRGGSAVQNEETLPQAAPMAGGVTGEIVGGATQSDQPAMEDYVPSLT